MCNVENIAWCITATGAEGRKSTGVAVHKVLYTGSGIAAHTPLAILNYIMRGVGIFIANMSRELKAKKKQYCRCGKGPLTLNKFGDLF